MSSLAVEIKDGLASKVAELFPSKVSSPYQWNLGSNSEKKNENIFAVRQGSLLSVRGSNLTATIDQVFTVIFSTKYINKPGNDEALADAIDGLSSDVETMLVAAYRTQFGLARVQVVSEFTAGEPQIDGDNGTVSIEMNFTVKYRKG